jgi:plastocyanin
MIWRGCDAARWSLVATLAVALVACANGSQPRQITLVARGMTFVLEDDEDTPNPVIAMRAGEQVRVILKNEAPGLIHDFRIDAWNVQIDPIRSGETAEVVFSVPSTPGKFEYVCHPHAEMMKGLVEVRR